MEAGIGQCSVDIATSFCMVPVFVNLGSSRCGNESTGRGGEDKGRAMVFGGWVEMTEVVMWQCDHEDYDTIPLNFVQAAILTLMCELASSPVNFISRCLHNSLYFRNARPVC